MSARGCQTRRAMHPRQPSVFCLCLLPLLLLPVTTDMLPVNRPSHSLFWFWAICASPLASFDGRNGYIFALGNVQWTSIGLVRADSLVFASTSAWKLDEDSPAPFCGAW